VLPEASELLPFAGEQNACWKDAAGSGRSWLPRRSPRRGHALRSFSAKSLQIPPSSKDFLAVTALTLEVIIC